MDVRDAIADHHGRSSFPWVRKDGSVDYSAYIASPEWRRRRKQVWKRSNGHCERCARGQMAEVHHLTYERLGYEEASDLQGLCSFCHAHIHGNDFDPIRGYASEAPALADVLPEVFLAFMGAQP